MKSDQAVTNRVEKMELVAYPGCSLCQKQLLNLKTIRDLLYRGNKEDEDRNYEEAARLFEESEIYFDHTIEHELKDGLHENTLRLKLKLSQARAKRLRRYLGEERKIEEEKRRIEKLRELQYE